MCFGLQLTPGCFVAVDRDRFFKRFVQILMRKNASKNPVHVQNLFGLGGKSSSRCH